MTNYQPRDVVRVLRHDPHGTRLLSGDEVAVAEVKTGADGRVILIVDTEQRRGENDNGRRMLYTTDVEPVTLVYRPAVPSTDIDERFVSILTADADLTAIFNDDAATALAAVEEEVSPVLTMTDTDVTEIDEDEDETEQYGDTLIRFTAPEDDDRHCMNITDSWGDHASFAYQEATAPDGSTVGRVMIFTDAEAGVSLRAEHLPRFIAWLEEKSKRTARE